MRPKETTRWYSAVGYLVTLILSLLAVPLAAEARSQRKPPGLDAHRKHIEKRE